MRDFNLFPVRRRCRKCTTEFDSQSIVQVAPELQPIGGLCARCGEEEEKALEELTRRRPRSGPSSPPPGPTSLPPPREPGGEGEPWYNR